MICKKINSTQLINRVHLLCLVTFLFFLRTDLRAQNDFLWINTAALDSTRGIPVGEYDSNWMVSRGTPSGPGGSYVPSLVVGNCAVGAWANSPYPNAKWIAYDFGKKCDHSAEGDIDIFFKRTIVLPKTNPCSEPISDNFCLAMDFFADNAVFEISVNGVTNYKYSKSASPYHFKGFHSPVAINICKGWKEGINELIVHVKSGPWADGFLAQISTSLSRTRWKYYNRTVKSSICEGESYRGYTKTGTYIDTIKSKISCDTLLRIELVVQPVKQSLITKKICLLDTPFLGVSTAGIHKDTLISFMGCDSIVTIDLTLVEPPPQIEITDTICSGSSYEFFAQPITQTGVYRKELVNKDGLCDTVVQLDLVVREPIVIELVDSICSGDYYEFRGQKLYTAGRYQYRISQLGHCDTVQVLELNENKCEQFDCYWWLPNAFSPNENGTNDSYNSHFDCDHKDFLFVIYNRWGQKLFETKNINHKWDGTYMNKPCQSGVYVAKLWISYFNGVEIVQEQKAASFHLLR